MEQFQKLDGATFAQMLCGGASNLKQNADAINDLNVFPIPDGDTGSNMLLTIMGGVRALQNGEGDIATVARRVADGMLLSARGNSGVILSQLFDGLAKGLENITDADRAQLCEAMKSGVKQAYMSVMEPCEGTILTVARCASEHDGGEQTLADYLRGYLEEAKRTLAQTPEMLPVLKKAGVVDSGGAGWICIIEGMLKVLLGDQAETLTDTAETADKAPAIDLDCFDENSVLEYGYCTELLLRLQRAKTDVEAFGVETITDYLKTVGESVVAFKTGSIVKIHVHTMTPDKVLHFCQGYGEFLTVKIENMSLQHNNTVEEKEHTAASEPTERKRYGIVAVCSGSGIKQMFTDRGADRIVDGGQSMNPSTEDLLQAVSAVHAETVFVLPNNGNVLLTAVQAARLCTDKQVIVIESKTVGEGYAALSMMDPDEADVEALAAALREAMSGVVTAEISHCIRDANFDGMELHVGEYIGVVGKKCIAAGKTAVEAALRTAEQLGIGSYDACIAIRGKDAKGEALAELECALQAQYPLVEVYPVDGMQDVYDYILILQ